MIREILTKKRTKLLIGISYTFIDLVYYHHGAAWWCAGRYRAREVTKYPTSGLLDKKKRSVSLYVVWACMRPQSQPPLWHIQADHTFSNMVTPTNSAPPSGGHFLSNHHDPVPSLPSNSSIEHSFYFSKLIHFFKLKFTMYICVQVHKYIFLNIWHSLLNLYNFICINVFRI